MVLSHKSKESFKLMQAKVAQAMARYSNTTPYLVDGDPVIRNYEIIRDVWLEDQPIKRVCRLYGLSRSQYYEKEQRFVNHGVPGLFPDVKKLSCSRALERLVVLISTARPALSQQAILRIAEAVPCTQATADSESVSEILSSYGRATSDLPTDLIFWSHIQRTLNNLQRIKQEPIQGRERKQRKKSFFCDDDFYHKRLELLRELFYDRPGIKELCLQYGISPTSYYRLVIV